jgi:hypothetical protein
MMLNNRVINVERGSMTDEDRAAYLAGDPPGEGLSAVEQAELDELRDLLADPSVWAAPGADLEERVVNAIGGADRASEPPPDELAKRRNRRVLIGLLAAAAAVLIGVGVGLAVTNSNSTPTHHPLQFAAALQPTALAPNASGHATLTKTKGGWRIAINATGLPRRDNGEYYEAWLKNADGVLVPIGTFNQPLHVTLWSGVPPSEFPTLTITKQVVGQSQQSSGLVVLVGPTSQVSP